ncbi:Protein transport protein SEC31 [Sphaceloma murrayae]|uniref:Protein transport protein SEC31 n=1 Tax=Sphaceloma murrayae TaxID=2082308 RepID=A0A2K1QHH0_9PEZI|nr:Protein transport protein SEC31 [Sphaceloma murrayae]
MSSFKPTSLFSRSSSGAANGLAPDFLDFLAIKNTLSLYCVALDTKDFDLLREVFTDDVEAWYPFAQMRGIDEIAYHISRRLAPATSQHALTTQHINFPPSQPMTRKKSGGKGPTSASVMTYFTATHFGKGQWTGRTLTTYGKYIDELIKVGDEDGYEGEGGGQWRVCKREVKFMARIGDERIMTSNARQSA